MEKQVFSYITDGNTKWYCPIVEGNLGKARKTVYIFTS